MARKERPSKKSKKRRVLPKQQHSIEDAIALADSAMEAMDIQRALNLYSSAATKLRNRLDVNESLDQGDGDDVKGQLSAVLGKLGEAKVSQGDQEGARQDFADAIELLTEHDSQEVTAKRNFQQLEIRGGLYLYLGQLSSDNDALDAYKHGIADFEKFLRERETFTSNTTTTNDDEMVEDEGDEDDGDQKNEVVLQETRYVSRGC